jgi:hypothetical protein
MTGPNDPPPPQPGPPVKGLDYPDDRPGDDDTPTEGDYY